MSLALALLGTDAWTVGRVAWPGDPVDAATVHRCDGLRAVHPDAGWPLLVVHDGDSRHLSEGLVVHAREVVLHPSADGQWTVLTWDPPSCSQVSGTLELIDDDGGSVEVEVWSGGAVVSAALSGAGDAMTFALPVGQSLSLFVGDGGDGFVDDSVRVALVAEGCVGL